MSEFITLSLMYEQSAAMESQKVPEPDSSRHIRNAFLALLAANIFVISGAISFGFLYMTH